MQVEQLLQKKGIYYQTSGRDFKVCCLNPEHDDTHPSMRIDRITGIFGCFVCGFKGNIFTYFEEKGNWLAIRRELLKKKIADKLVENIGLEMPKNAIPFTQDWRSISRATYERFEAFQHSDSQFIGRIVFPIRSFSGKIVGFNGRSLSPSTTTKYLIYPDRAKFPLYPTRPEQNNGRVIIVEGLFDMLNLHDKGLTNAVCAFGTRKLTKAKLNLLKMQGVNGIDIMYDPDDAGQEAAEEARKMCEEAELVVRNITLKEGDPGELTASKVVKLREQLYG